MKKRKLTREEIRQRQMTSVSTLGLEDAAHIRWQLLNGWAGRKRELAEVYGVTLETIRKLARGDSWVGVEPRRRGEPPEAVDNIPPGSPPPFDMAASLQRLAAKMNGALPTAGDSLLNKLLQEANELKAKQDANAKLVGDLLDSDKGESK